MDNKKDNLYVQCTRCGFIKKIDVKINEDDIYINTTCPKCGNNKALCCYDDYYKYYDVNLDQRYYNY